jgi:multicomponent Na+:H+ antiporter subunit F
MNAFVEGPATATAAILLPLLSLAFVLALVRLILGPGLPDRVVALDLMAAITVGIMATYSILTGETAVLDAAMVVALITFLGTIAFASYLERGGAR